MNRYDRNLARAREKARKLVDTLSDEDLVHELSSAAREVGGFENLTIDGKYDYSDSEEEDIMFVEALEEELIRRLADTRAQKENES